MINRTFSYLLALLLLIIGGINWGFVGLLDINIIAALLGEKSLFARFIYGLVGISAVYIVVEGYRGYRQLTKF